MIEQETFEDLKGEELERVQSTLFSRVGRRYFNDHDNSQFTLVDLAVIRDLPGVVNWKTEYHQKKRRKLV